MLLTKLFVGGYIVIVSIGLFLMCFEKVFEYYIFLLDYINP